VELRRGAGAYICGEETALFNSIEGKRGEPRNKPPFPVQRGLFGKPTGINNVETLINVLEILRIGAAAYAQLGTEGSTGPRLFCLSGAVAKPGLYEVEHGATVRDVLALAGGVRGELKALLLGGAAGSFVGADALDLRLTFEDAKAGGYTLGSGVVMAFDDAVDLVDVVLRIARFFRDESCGQCVPCRVGTVRQEEALHRLVVGRTLGSRDDEVGLLGEIAEVMRDASICGLGQTAANAVQSAISTLGVFANGSSSGGGEFPTPTEEQES
jgi:NADH-quinone oxidoreductase subunit F